MEAQVSLPFSQQPDFLSVLKQTNPIYVIPSYVCCIHFNIVCSYATGCKKWSFLSVFPPKSCIYFFHKRVFFPTHLNKYFIALILFGDIYKSRTSSLCNPRQSLVTFPLLCPHEFLSTLFSVTFSLRSSLYVSNLVSHTYNTTRNIMFQYL
jgi:hypothetical protein